MTVEIFNPQLSDFTAEQLRLITESLLKEQMQLRQHIDGLKQYSSLNQMMRVEIRQYEEKLLELRDVIVQFAGALQIKERENQIASN